MQRILTAKIFLMFLFASCTSSGVDESKIDTTKTGNPKITRSDDISEGPSRLYGIDISSYQGDEADFLNKNQDTLSFVICRATLGITFTDSTFENNWKVIKKKEFVRGAYHFYECDDDPQKQAQHYLSVIGTLAPNDLPPILDFEQAGLAGVTDKQKIQTDLLTFLTAVETATGRTPLIYVSPEFSNAYLSNPAFSKYPLYVADYNGKNEPMMPQMWSATQWTFWQKTDTVHVNGNQNDFDVFNGNMETLNKFIEKK